MTRGRNGSPSRLEVVGDVGGRAHGRMGFTLLGMLWVGLLGLFWGPGALSAAWQQASAPTAAGAFAADLPARQGEETLISPYDVLFIQVFDVEQMTHEYRVSGTGGVDFPLLPDPVPGGRIDAPAGRQGDFPELHRRGRAQPSPNKYHGSRVSTTFSRGGGGGEEPANLPGVWPHPVAGSSHPGRRR